MNRSLEVALGCTIAALIASPLLRAQEATLAPGTALRVELDHRVRIHVGASVTGHLSEPVYLVDHQVIPKGALVYGTIRGTHPGPRGEHVRQLLAADFTPLRVPNVVFTSLTIPATAATASRTVLIEAPAVQTDASVLTLGTRKQRQSIKAQLTGVIKQRVQEAKDTLRHHQFTEIVEKWAVGQLPYHPEILWSNARFNADLAMPADVPDTPHPDVPTEDLRGHLPAGTLYARLLSSLTSETAKRGDPVEAIITRPLFSPDGAHLLVPQGTHISGVIVRTRPARTFGRNGDLRFAFRNLDLPTENAGPELTEIHGRLSGAETAPGQHVTIDEEGQVQAGDGPGKYAEPIVLALLAGAARGDPDHRGGGDGVGPGAQTVSSNGFGLIARVVSLSTQNTQVLQGFAYYSLAKSLYFNFVAKGHNTTFPHDTEIEVTLSER